MGAPSGVFRDFRAIATQSKHNASIPKQCRNTNQSLTRSDKCTSLIWVMSEHYT